MSLYRVTGRNFCCGVVTKHNIIVITAPILQRFRQQHIGNLKHWAKKVRYVRLEKLEEKK